MTVCIIPARGGSTRIPRKNVREFFGRPMIAWAIEAAGRAECFDRVIVSTDDNEIADTARAVGAEVPFMRPPALSDDKAPTAPVIADAISRLGISLETPVCCLYATAPFVQADDIAQALRVLGKNKARFVVSVTTFPFPIQRALRRSDNGAIEMMEPVNMLVRSQDLEEAWHDAGQFYWARAKDWMSHDVGIFSEGAFGLPIPRYRVQDIDTEEDWIRAEMMMRALKADEDRPGD